MLALLTNEARHRGLRSCVMTFEPHPRDWFAQKAGKPELAPLRIAPLRDKLAELQLRGYRRPGLALDTWILQATREACLTGWGHAFAFAADDARFREIKSTRLTMASAVPAANRVASSYG